MIITFISRKVYSYAVRLFPLNTVVLSATLLYTLSEQHGTGDALYFS